MSPLKFAKGGSSSKSPVRTPDSLVSTDTVEVLLGISEGPIKGLVNGARTFRADDTPLENNSGEANFENFELDVWPGSELGHTVIMELGGFSNPLNIGVTLAQNTPVVRSGTVKGINAADFRIVVQQLLKQTDKGVFKADLSLKFEIKKKTDAAWQLAWISDTSANVGSGGAVGGGGGTGGIGSGNNFEVLNFASDPIDNGDHETWRSYGRVNDLLTFAGDTQTVVTTGAPTAPPENPTVPAVAYDETNTDVIYHWTSGGGWQVETPAADPGGAYTVLADGRRQYPLGVVPPTGARPGDLWLRLQLIKVIPTVWNGSAWVLGSEYRAETPPPAVSGVWTTHAKVSSPTAKDIRVFLPDAGPDDEWEYRLTKLSPDSNDETFSVVQWESVQEINRTPMHFQGVALARVIGRASDQFTSLPNWNGDWLGRVVKLPSNYDPVARTYTGVWDGTYKIDWTDNNAFIFQDFVENTRYGLSSVFPHTVNKWSIYEFGRHCDVMVDRPDGSKRPRWTYNDYIQEPRDAKELAQYIAGSAGARYVDDGNGIVEIIVDRDTPAVAIFTPENVGEDGFSYSYTDRLTRANEITIEFVNPDLNWNRDKRIVRMPDDIALYGRIPENFIAVGCIDVDEALARGRRRLIGGLTEKELVTFKTNRKGKFLSEWDVILIGDPAMGRGITGRIRQVVGPRGVTLRDPLTFEPGVEYWATFDVVNPDYPTNSSAPFRTERRQITNSAGTEQRLLTFATDLPNLAGHAAFVVEAEGIAGFPKPYRITTISDDSGSGDDIQISALELNRNKWTYIDTGEDQGQINYSNFTAGEVLPATNPTITIENRQKGLVSVRVLTLAWDKSPSPWVRRYRVYHSKDGTPVNSFEPTSPSVEIEGLDEGQHTFTIVAIDIRGRESRPLSLVYTLVGEGSVVSEPTNLRLVGGLTVNTFEDLSPKVAWDAPTEPDPLFHHYVVAVSDTATNVVLRTENVGQQLEWRYDIVQHKTDTAGIPKRNLTFRVAAVNSKGDQSPFITLPVSNPSPAAPTITTRNTTSGAIVSLSPSEDRDVVGAILRYGPTSNPTQFSIKGNQSSFEIPLDDWGVYQVQGAYYDVFSENGLFWSAILDVQRSGIPSGDPTVSALQDAINAAGEGLEQIGDAVDGLNQTVYDAQTGLQVRTGQLWDDINDAADGLKVRTAGLDQAINAAGTGLADRTDALFDRLDAPGTGIEARVTDLAQTVEEGDEASIERFQALEAFAAAGPNHCPNGGLAEGLEGIHSGHTLVWGVSGTWGPNVAIAPSGDGTYSVAWPEFGVEEGVAYTVSGDAVLFASGGVVYFDIVYLNASGQAVFDGGESPRGPGDFSDSFERRKSMAGTSVCPLGSGAVTARARCVFENVVNPTAMGVRRVKVDFGDKPTAWSDETTEWQGASRLIDLDEVVQNPTSGLVRRTELLDSQLNTPTVGLSAQIASARQAITDLDEGKAEASDVQALNTQINTPGTGLAAQQLSAQEAISDLEEGKASASDLDALTSEITTARGGQTSLNLRLNTVESDIDGKASATALQTLESEVNAPGTGIVARLTDAEGTVADLMTGKAEASDLEALEVRSRSLPNLVPNSAAAQDRYLWDGDPIWKVGYGADVGSYFFCDAAGDHYMVSRPIRLGHNKTYSFEFEGDGGSAPTENSVYFDLMDGTDSAPGGIVQYGAGARSYQGVGWFTRKGSSFTTGPTVKWGVAVVKKAAASNYVTMTRLMLNDGPVAAAWTDTLVGRDLSARQLEMERVVLTPTTGLSERVFGLSSDLYTPTTGIAARLGSAQQALVDLNENKASASDVEALESSINTPGTGLLAEMVAVKETLVDLDEGKASASDVQDIQSALFTPTTGISARLTQVLQTAADLEQEKADVTALQQLEAITGVRENLAINGGLTDGLEGLSSNTDMVLDEDSWGRSVKLVTFTGTGTRFITWPTIKVDPNTIYTISGDAVLFASGGVVYFDMIFVDAAGQVVGDGGEKARGPGDFSNAPGRRQDMAFAQMSPGTAVRATPRCIFESVVNPNAMGARMLKIERGGLPATTWSDEASAAYTAAKLADLNRVVTTPTTGLASRLIVTESEINTPGTGLKARQQALTEALTDLDQGKASVLSVNELTAQLRSVPNQIANSGAKFDMDRWNGAPAWVVGHSGDIGDYFVCSASGEQYLVSQPFRLSPNTTYTQSFEGDGGSDPGACSAYLDLLGGTETTPGGIVRYGAGETSFNGAGWFTRKSVTFTTGPDVLWGQYVVRKAATSSYVAATRFMLNLGDKAVAWTDSLSERELRASIQEVRSVAVSADGRSKAIVGNVLDVNGYVSGTASTNDGVQARFEVLADVFGIRSPGGGERTEYRSGRWYIYSPAEATRTVYGKAFGGDQKVIWWTGPDTVAEGAETKGNAYVYISQNTVGGPRFGGSDIVGPGGTLTATANTGFIGGARTGAGYVNTSNQVTVTVSGGTAGATIRWVRISGDSRIGMNDPTAFNTGAGATIGVGEVISAYFMGAVTKGGQSAVVYVQVDLSDNGT